MGRGLCCALFVAFLLVLQTALHAADDPNWLANPGFEEGDGSAPAGW